MMATHTHTHTYIHTCRCYIVLSLSHSVCGGRGPSVYEIFINFRPQESCLRGRWCWCWWALRADSGTQNLTTQHSSNEICDMYDRLEKWGGDSPEFNPDSDLATVTHQRATTCDSGKKYAMICRTLVVRLPPPDTRAAWTFNLYRDGWRQM